MKKNVLRTMVLLLLVIFVTFSFTSCFSLGWAASRAVDRSIDRAVDNTVDEAIDESMDGSIIYPRDGSTNIPLTVTFKWESMDSDDFTVDWYELYLELDGVYTPGDTMIGAPSRTEWTHKGLKPNTKYRWHYVARGTDGQYIPGGGGTFTTGKGN